MKKTKKTPKGNPTTQTTTRARFVAKNYETMSGEQLIEALRGAVSSFGEGCERENRIETGDPRLQAPVIKLQAALMGDSKELNYHEILVGAEEVSSAWNAHWKGQARNRAKFVGKHSRGTIFLQHFRLVADWIGKASGFPPSPQRPSQRLDRSGGQRGFL